MQSRLRELNGEPYTRRLVSTVRGQVPENLPLKGGKALDTEPTLNLTATKSDLKVVFDQAGTPTYAQDLADAIYHIIENRCFEGREGVYHYSNEGVCSWYDFTKAIAEIAGNNTCDIQPCHSAEFPSKVIRPSYSVLDKTKFKDMFGISVPYWTDSLKTCITNLKTNEA